MAYNENSLISWNNKVVPIKDVSASWLLQWYAEHRDRNYAGHKRKLQEWVGKNITILQNRLFKERQVETSDIINNICVKVPYSNKKDADAALKTILANSKFDSWNKRLKRAYKCPKCQFYHLTSKS